MRLCGWLSGLMLVITAGRAATFVSLSPTLNTLVPDANPTGVSTTLELSGLPHQITDLNVFLTLTGGANGDLYASIAHGDSAFCVLLNRVGKTDDAPFGYADAGFDNVTFDDQADTDVHTYGGNLGLPLTGTWQPDSRTEDPQLVTDASDRLAPLSAFDGFDPNGTWTLFLSDMASEHQATLVSWGVELAAVPEPAVAARCLFLSLMVAVAWKTRRPRPFPRRSSPKPAPR